MSLTGETHLSMRGIAETALSLALIAGAARLVVCGRHYQKRYSVAHAAVTRAFHSTTHPTSEYMASLYLDNPEEFHQRATLATLGTVILAAASGVLTWKARWKILPSFATVSCVGLAILSLTETSIRN